MTATRPEKGRQGESIAREFLERQGIEVLAQNARCALGEIDLVGRDGRTIVFVEVRSRYSRGFGSPQESISLRKRKRLTRLAQWYRQRHRLERLPARFDVIAVAWHTAQPEVTWIPNAFDAIE